MRFLCRVLSIHLRYSPSVVYGGCGCCPVVVLSDRFWFQENDRQSSSLVEEWLPANLLSFSFVSSVTADDGTFTNILSGESSLLACASCMWFSTTSKDRVSLSLLVLGLVGWGDVSVASKSPEKCSEFIVVGVQRRLARCVVDFIIEIKCQTILQWFVEATVGWRKGTIFILIITTTKRAINIDITITIQASMHPESIVGRSKLVIINRFSREFQLRSFQSCKPQCGGRHHGIMVAVGIVLRRFRKWFVLQLNGEYRHLSWQWFLCQFSPFDGVQMGAATSKCGVNFDWWFEDADSGILVFIGNLWAYFCGTHVRTILNFGDNDAL